MKQIDIQELIPYLKDGWVAMDKCGIWYWSEKEPYTVKDFNGWLAEESRSAILSIAFNIKPAKNWRKSLTKVENKDE